MRPKKENPFAGYHKMSHWLAGACSVGMSPCRLPKGFSVQIFFHGEDSDTNAKAYSLSRALMLWMEKAKKAEKAKQQRTAKLLAELGGNQHEVATDGD